ncbi:MAG: GxxExxY protein [Alphaproteobacteria bacterium]|nr:GxxExxY protein [Alphaproteobacteria bacterium]
MLVHREVTRDVIGAAVEVHRRLGPGLLESAYRKCLAFELADRGRATQAEVALDLDDKGHHVPRCFRLDLLVDDVVVVEIKAVDQLLPVHKAQLMTYLHLSHRRVGLLFNFRSPKLTDAMERIVV